MTWFRAGSPPHQTSLAMIGAKAGQSVVFLGSANPGLAAEVARVTGLNGRVLVVGEGDEARIGVEASAACAGALVEFFGGPPTDVRGEPAGAFDVAAVTAAAWALWPGSSRDACASEALRLVRPGGRVIVVLVAAPARWPRRTQSVPRDLVDDTLGRLTAAGARAARLLGEVSGTTYVEAVKPKLTAGT